MPDINLPKGIQGTKEFPRFREHLVNLIWTEYGLLRAFGIDSFADGFGVCRGAITWVANGISYMVSGTKFISVSDTGELKELGSIAGDADCEFSQGQVNLVIIVKGGAGYRYNTTEGLVQITDPDFLPSNSADFIDGRHVFIPSDGSPAFYSEVDNAGSIEPLSFFDAEELPDKNRVVINISNQLHILGDDSGEIFRTNADPDVVFKRREGGRVDVGFIGGLTRFNNTFAFIGRRREESPRVYVMLSGVAEAISNISIDEILQDEYTLDELKRCDSMRYEQSGIEVICFNLNKHTLIYANGQWSYRSSGKTLRNWTAKAICNANKKYIVGDRESGRIGVLSKSGQEYGVDVEAEIITFARSERQGYFKIKKVNADVVTGRKSPAESIGLAISRDGETYGQVKYISLGEVGEYNRQIKWQPPGGIGQFESFAGIKIRTTTDSTLTTEFLSFE
jgi:hypothetical protein